MRDSGDMQGQEIVSKGEFVGSIGWNGPGTPISPAPLPHQSPPRPGYPMHWQIRHMHLQTHTNDTLTRGVVYLALSAGHGVAPSHAGHQSERSPS